MTQPAAIVASTPPKVAETEMGRKLRSTKFTYDYYREHAEAGLDYAVYGGWQRGYGKWFVESLELQGKHVLDLGCACGMILRGMGEAGAIVAGLEVNEAMVTVGVKTFPDMSPILHVGDAVNMHMFGDGQFDCIHSAQVFEHFKPWLVPYILLECWRVLKPGGRLFVCLDTEEQYRRQNRRLEDEDPTHWCVRSHPWWNQRLNQCGFSRLDEAGARSLREHPDSYMKMYDWDWLLLRRDDSTPPGVGKLLVG